MTSGARLLAAALLAACAASASARPPEKPLDLRLRLPPGPPPADRLAAVEAQDRGFTLNAGVLERYGFTLDGYNALSSSEQQRVFDWVRLLERERLLAEARAAAGAGGAAPGAPSVLKGQAAASQQAALERLRGSMAFPGRVFDGAGAGAGTGAAAAGGGTSGFTPELELFGGPLMQPDGAPGPGGVRRFTLSGPDGFRLEYGTLGLDGRSPLVAQSPYLSLSREGGSGRGTVDYEYKWRLNAVDLGARLYTDDAHALDGRIDAGIDSLKSLDPQWGVTQGDIDRMRQELSFSSAFERQWLAAGSAMGRVGRAWSLLPGVDAGCSAMGLVRVTGLFPNATADQTCGARFGLGAGQHLGLFAGVTEGLGLFDKTVVSDSLAADDLKTHIHPELAPHGEAVLWGKLPYLSNAEYTLSGGRQYNPWTTVTSVAASVSGPVGSVKAGAFGAYSSESGPDMEFDRSKAAAGLSVTPSPGVDLWAQYQQDSARFGEARMDARGVMLGLTLSETQGRGKGAKVTLETLFGGREEMLSSRDREQFVELLQQDLRALQALKDAGLAFAGGPGGAWKGVQDGYASLPEDLKRILGEAWTLAAPGAPSLADIVRVKPADFNTLNTLLDLLSDTEVMERMLVRALRHQILTKLQSVDIPVLGRGVRLSAPMVLAAANAYSLSLSPLPPITEKDARGALDPYLLGKLSGAAGCAAGPQPRATTDCILKGLPDDVRAGIEDQYGGNIDQLLKAAVAWPSDVLRRELDRMALQIILAAETLNDLSVDQGERIADLNVRGMLKSFEFLDERGRRAQSKVLHAASEALKSDLAADDASLRAQLSEYGSARLDWLQKQAAWPSNVRVVVRPDDWAPLLAVYGDAKLFDLILRAKGSLARSHPSSPARLLISLDAANPLNAVTLVRGDPAELRLPPRAVDLSAIELP
jgi:hypothetical protein